jgi:hypothetical protein
MLPFGTAIGLPQTMHFLVGSDIAGSVPQINKLPIDQLMILICLGFSTTISKPYCGWSLMAPIISTSLFSKFFGGCWFFSKSSTAELNMTAVRASREGPKLRKYVLLLAE